MMDANQVLQEVQNIFRDVLDNDAIVLNEHTVANDVEEWDSLSHIQLVVAIEKKFKIKFTTAEITGWKNIGDLTNNAMIKLNK